MRLLRFARNDGIPGILNEIAPSALLPHNDRIPAMMQGILEFPRKISRNSRIKTAILVSWC